jgi:type II secretory pathway component GspD/PulD (secretin)
MKTTITTLLTAICVSGLLLSAAAQPTPGGTADDNAAATPDQSAPPPGGTDLANTNPPEAGVPPPEATTQGQGAMNGQEVSPAQPAEAAPAQSQPVKSTVILPRGNAPQVVASAFPPPAQPIGKNPNDLNLNFQNAPLDMVLGYLSDAAGFIIVQETRVSGTVTVIGQHLTQDQAVNLLNTELNRNGYAAVRNGRMLTIMTKTEAKTQNIPVLTGNDPGAIPDNDEIATWIIPIRFVDAQQLVSDLSSFVSPQATIVANQAGNSIVITDTQSNIRHLAEIIKSVDDSAQMETEIRVFRLKYANPNDVATELGSIFPSSTSGNGPQAPVRFGGGGGGRGGFLARMMAANGANSQNARVQKATQVTAVADQRIQAVIVSAPNDLMNQIADMMTSLDVPSDRDQHVSVIPLDNADPYQVQQVLQNMFGNSSTTSRGGASSTTTSPLQIRAQNGTTTMGTTTTTSGIGGAGTGRGGTAGRAAGF